MKHWKAVCASLFTVVLVINPTGAQEKVTLPHGPAPTQALASLTQDGTAVVLRIPHRYYDATVHPIAAKKRTSLHAYEIQDVRVHKVGGNGGVIKAQELVQLLSKETLVLYCYGDLDPLHFRTIKEGTLIFVLTEPPFPVLMTTPAANAADFYVPPGTYPTTPPFTSPPSPVGRSVEVEKGSNKNRPTGF